MVCPKEIRPAKSATDEIYYPNLENMTDIELVVLQSEARKARDTDFVNAILIELGKRQRRTNDN